MEKGLLISVALNVAALGIIAMLLSDGYRMRPADAGLHPYLSNKTQTSVSAPPTDATGHPRFEWSQLESTNYAIYVHNLRNIGCPEETIRDLITADLDAGIYARRRSGFQQMAKAKSTGPSATRLANQTLEEELQGLRREEDELLSTLMGDRTETAPHGTPLAGRTVVTAEENRRQPEADPPSRSYGEMSPDPISPPARPLRNGVEVKPPEVFAESLLMAPVDLSRLGLDASRLKVVDNLRQGFAGQVGASQDPTDPGYHQRWRKAQPAYDEMLRGTIGINAWLDWQVQQYYKTQVEPK